MNKVPLGTSVQLRIDKGSQRSIMCAYMFFDHFNVTFILTYMINRPWEVY